MTRRRGYSDLRSALTCSEAAFSKTLFLPATALSRINDR